MKIKNWPPNSAFKHLADTQLSHPWQMHPDINVNRPAASRYLETPCYAALPTTGDITHCTLSVRSSVSFSICPVQDCSSVLEIARLNSLGKFFCDAMLFWGQKIEEQGHYNAKVHTRNMPYADQRMGVIRQADVVGRLKLYCCAFFFLPDSYT